MPRPVSAGAVARGRGCAATARGRSGGRACRRRRLRPPARSPPRRTAGRTSAGRERRTAAQSSSPHGCSCCCASSRRRSATACASSSVAELDQRLDELRRDGEHAGLFHSFAAQVLPDDAKALCGTLRLVRQQRGDAARAQRLEPVPADAGRLGTGERFARPALCLFRPVRGRRRAARGTARTSATSAAPRIRPTRRGGSRRLRSRRHEARARRCGGAATRTSTPRRSRRRAPSVRPGARARRAISPRQTSCWPTIRSGDVPT